MPSKNVDPERAKMLNKAKYARRKARQIEAKKGPGVRVCAEESCGTILSRYNTDPRCAIHMPAVHKADKNLNAFF